MDATLIHARGDYLRYREGCGVKPATLLKDAQCLKALERHYGECTLLSRLDDLSEFFAPGKFTSASQRNACISVFRSFFEWCHRKRLLPPTVNPMMGLKHAPIPPKEKKYIPAEQFGTLLNSAAHPVERATIALGLYAFLRQSEISTLRVRDVHETHLSVHVWKTNKFDLMPLGEELAAEMRRWRFEYLSDSGRLEDDWYLVPSRSVGSYKGPLVPHARCEKPYKATQRALARMGWTDEEIEGEGGHLLRRSGARAWYLRLRGDKGAEHAMDLVQRRLHHTSRAMSERYIGMTISDGELSDLLVGREMFPEEPLAQVIPFRRRA